MTTVDGYEIVAAPPGRSSFDRWRWRCTRQGADSCGVWHSATSPMAAREALDAHAREGHGLVDRRNLHQLEPV